MSTEDLTDQELLDQFEQGNITPSDWTHPVHLRLAHMLLTDYSYDDAVRKMTAGIRKYFENHRDAVHRFNETQTVAWMQLLAAAINANGARENANAFIAANPHLADKHVTSRYYSDELLHSEAARSSFVAPDLLPLPSAD